MMKDWKLKTIVFLMIFCWSSTGFAKVSEEALQRAELNKTFPIFAHRIANICYLSNQRSSNNDLSG
jgi:hypothetical protein